jgi:hypothetical protein
MYACLGYHRKEAYLLREVLGCVMDLLVCGREETESHRYGPSATSSGVQNIHSPGSDSDSRSRNANVARSEDGNGSLIKLVAHICRVLGVNLDLVELVRVESPGEPVKSGESSTTGSENWDDAYDALHTSYGWPELQVGVVREAVAVAEALPGS